MSRRELVLGALTDHAGEAGLTITNLGDRLDRLPSWLAPILRELERDGLVERDEHQRWHPISGQVGSLVNSTQLFGFLVDLNRAELDERAKGPWRPDLAAPIEWTTTQVWRACPSTGSFERTRQLLDELVGRNALTRHGGGSGGTAGRRPYRWRLA